MNNQSIRLWINRKLKKDSFLFSLIRSFYRIKIVKSGIREIRKYEKNWRIENVSIEITYRCNKLCKNCNRHCNLTKLPYHKETDMTIEQIEKFIKQVKQKKIHLNTIHILGGEPLLHPRLSDFISILYYKLLIPGNALRLLIWTNGIIDLNLIMKDLHQDYTINKAYNDKKIAFVVSPNEKEKTFADIFLAPVDFGFKWNICGWPRECGILLNYYGYWPGGVCGKIALLFNMIDYAKYDLPKRFGEAWPHVEEELCKYCVVGCKELVNEKNRGLSLSYKNAISKWMNGTLSIPKQF